MKKNQFKKIKKKTRKYYAFPRYYKIINETEVFLNKIKN